MGASAPVGGGPATPEDVFGAIRRDLLGFDLDPAEADRL